MALIIRLLGPPALERDGEPAPPPRGRKGVGAAGLPAAGRPPGRRHLAELLFGDAEDPLVALRWTLAELRRAIGAPGLFRGDPAALASARLLAAGIDNPALAPLLDGAPAG